MLICFVEGADNRRLEYGLGLDAAGRRDLVARHVAYALDDERARAPIAVYEKQWADDAWARGAYDATLPPGVLSGGFATALDALCADGGGVDGGGGGGAPHLFLAGADYSSVSSGYIDGAVHSGAAAARRILSESP